MPYPVTAVEGSRHQAKLMENSSLDEAGLYISLEIKLNNSKVFLLPNLQQAFKLVVTLNLNKNRRYFPQHMPILLNSI